MGLRREVLVILTICSVSLLAGKDSPSHPDIQLDDFIHSIANVALALLKRERSELICSLAFTLSAQGIAQHISKSLRPRDYNEGNTLCQLVSCKNLALAMRLSEKIYDPKQVHLEFPDLEMLSCQKDAEYLQPSFFVLRSRMEAVTWIVIRGTTSLGDLLTDLRTTSEPFMDGMVHQGILRAASYILERIRSQLLKTDRIWLTGHSLGAAVAAICAGQNTRSFESCRSKFLFPLLIFSRPAMLRAAGYKSKAVAFGPPACLELRPAPPHGAEGAGAAGEAAGARLTALLRSHVVSVIADADVVPRLSQRSLVDLVAPRVRRCAPPDDPLPPRRRRADASIRLRGPAPFPPSNSARRAALPARGRSRARRRFGTPRG